MVVHRIKNNYRSSNCFIIEISETEVLVIDPGGPAIDEVIAKINDFGKVSILLTHEHPDHCMGVNALAEKYNSSIIASTPCALNIKSSKTNYSLYAHDISSFEISRKVLEVVDYQVIGFGGVSLDMIETPGHSPGGLCIYEPSENILFSGDTLLPDVISYTALPHSRLSDLRDSFEKILSRVNDSTMIYPGHGDPLHFGQLIETVQSIEADKRSKEQKLFNEVCTRATNYFSQI